VLSRHPWLATHIAWLIAWITLDLLGGGLIAAGFNTAGLQQAYMLLLYLLGVAVLLLVWASVRIVDAVNRRSPIPPS
jgi:hypothetical protein